MSTLLRIVHISDTHINADTSYQPYDAPTPIVGARKLVEAVNALPFMPDAILHTGDVVYDPVPGAYPAAQEVLSALKAPVHFVVGNHDSAAELQRVLLGRDEADVQPYLYYETEINGVQLIVLDSNGPAELPAGYIVPEQLEWLRGVLSRLDDRPLIVATHHNVLPVGAPWLDDWMRTTNGEELHAVLKMAGSRLKAVLYGHIHQNYTIQRDGILYMSAASSWGQFVGYPTPENTEVVHDTTAQPGFNVLHLTTEGVSVRVHQFASWG
ncbi:MAG: metallophosphoesterase [Anaerolineae bacterium]|nr:metallophosphoesterase [Anaerolineae bacterium]